MKASFAKLDNGWGVRVTHEPDSPDIPAGTEVSITKRDGATKQVTVGACVLTWNGGRTRVYEIRAGMRAGNGSANGGQERVVKVTEPGVYETPEGVVYVVKPNREKTRLYAKRLVEINAERTTELGGRVQIEFEYEGGAIYKLEPGMKMELERAKALTIRYGRCIVCGRKLEAAESVERGIGPVCIKSFRNYDAAAEALPTQSEWMEQR